MLEKSWDGFAVHTEQGYNVGKPCYGFLGVSVPHPVPARRAKGAKKTRLAPDPERAPVVRRIFEMRVGERLGYPTIADRLNADLVANPPPVPPDPARAVGRWTTGNVREVLTNPKHTGHMVWNRNARQSARNRPNPVEQWVWSAEPVHEQIVDLETFVQAQQVAAHRFGSRTDPGLNPHPEARRVYPLRTYVFCDLCGRRMGGETRRKATVYYGCAPKKGYRPAGHPPTTWVREDALVAALDRFLGEQVFGEYRRALLVGEVDGQLAAAGRERDERLTRLRRELADTDRRSKRLATNLELIDDPDQDFIRDLNERCAQLRQQGVRLRAELAAAEEEAAQAPNPALLDVLPTGALETLTLSSEIRRRLFEALRLEIRYNKITNRATFRISLSGATVRAAAKAAGQAVVLPMRQRQQGRLEDEPAGGRPRWDPCRVRNAPRYGPVPAGTWGSRGLGPRGRHDE